MPNHNKKNLSEDCFKIELGHFGKKLLHPVDSKKMTEFPEVNNLVGKEGNFVIDDGYQELYVSFSMDLARSPKVLKIWFKKNPQSLQEGTSQEIEVEEDIITFGIRPFFLCSCGHKAAVLYKPPGKTLFGCRKCNNIIYESSRISKHTIHGQLRRFMKLDEKKQKIERMFYNGHLSQKGQKWVSEFKRFQSNVDHEALLRAHFELAFAGKSDKIKKEFLQSI